MEADTHRCVPCPYVPHLVCQSGWHRRAPGAGVAGVHRGGTGRGPIHTVSYLSLSFPRLQNVLTHSLTRSLTHSLTHSLICSLTNHAHVHVQCMCTYDIYSQLHLILHCLIGSQDVNT